MGYGQAKHIFNVLGVDRRVAVVELFKYFNLNTVLIPSSYGVTVYCDKLVTSKDTVERDFGSLYKVDEIGCIFKV